jgi:exodeoxyribonuclease VII large subunit
MWRSAAVKLKFRLEQGMHIVVEGSISVYTPRGEYQFYAVHIEPYGKGALALAYEQLKSRLQEKGYFDAQRKKSIPRQIRKLALVTAKESAALYDMLKIIEQRWPLIEVTIVDTLVQGDQAAIQIARALRYADGLNADVVVVGRGGGSAEDLWCFNEEVVADAIFGMQTPVVSAVGHEVDVMISDFVADLRAPTPSAAMEMILPDKREMFYMLDEIGDRYGYVIEQKLQKFTRELKHAEEILLRSSPTRQLKETEMKFQHLSQELKRAIAYRLERTLSVLPELHQSYQKNMRFIVDQKSQYLDYIDKKFSMADPKLQCHQGWGKLSLAGKSIALDEIDVNQTFFIEDASIQLEALCVSKKTF